MTLIAYTIYATIKTKEINIQIITPNFNFIQNYNSLYSNRPIYITFH
nr:MAG TPA: hypothetical protein [Caudoviricetes sp.]